MSADGLLWFQHTFSKHGLVAFSVADLPAEFGYICLKLLRPLIPAISSLAEFLLTLFGLGVANLVAIRLC